MIGQKAALVQCSKCRKHAVPYTPLLSNGNISSGVA